MKDQRPAQKDEALTSSDIQSNDPGDDVLAELAAACGRSRHGFVSALVDGVEYVAISEALRRRASTRPGLALTDGEQVVHIYKVES